MRTRGARGEAFVHPVETADEGLHVAQQIQSGHAVERRQHCARCYIHHSKLALEQPGGRAEQTDGTRVEQLEQAARRIEEVDRLGRRRSVEDQQVGGRIGGQLEQLFHRHVIGDARERARQIAVDSILENRVARRVGHGVARDDGIEGALRVEAQRAQPRAIRCAAASRPADAVERSLDRLGGIRREPQRVEQARRGVYRHHVDGASEYRGAHGERGADGSLADAAGPEADDEALRGKVERLAMRVMLRVMLRLRLGLHRSSSPASKARRSCSISARPIAGVNIIGSPTVVSPGGGEPRCCQRRLFVGGVAAYREAGVAVERAHRGEFGGVEE